MLNRIVLPVKDGVNYLPGDIILYFQAFGNYAKVYLLNEKKTLVVLKNLKSIESDLKSMGFFRIHVEYLINLAHLVQYNKKDRGTIILHQGIELPLARARKKEFLRLMAC